MMVLASSFYAPKHRINPQQLRPQILFLLALRLALGSRAGRGHAAGARCCRGGLALHGIKLLVLLTVSGDLAHTSV